MTTIRRWFTQARALADDERGDVPGWADIATHALHVHNHM